MGDVQVDVGGGRCRKHGGGRRCGVEGCVKTDVGGEWLCVVTAGHVVAVSAVIRTYCCTREHG